MIADVLSLKEQYQFLAEKKFDKIKVDKKVNTNTRLPWTDRNQATFSKEGRPRCTGCVVLKITRTIVHAARNKSEVISQRSWLEGN